MNSLNILHINNCFGLGGAFIAAYNLHQGLSRAGIQSFFAYKDEIEGVFREKANDLKNTVEIVQRNNQFVDLANSIATRVGLNLPIPQLLLLNMKPVIRMLLYSTFTQFMMIIFPISCFPH